MLRGERVELRTRREEDVPILHAELYEDVATSIRSDTRPWRPVAVSASQYGVGQEGETTAAFSIVELASGELAGEASVWGINQFHRFGHIGMGLRPSFRGRGLGTDTVRVLCYYGFAIRGLHRMQLETLADNAAMRAVAERAGFVQEGQMRATSWVDGEFVDEIVFGLLADEWARRRGATS